MPFPALWIRRLRTFLAPFRAGLDARSLGLGLSLDAVLRDAQSKHAGADPATLAWVLGTWKLPPTASLPEGSTLAEVEAFRQSLISALARLALPPA